MQEYTGRSGTLHWPPNGMDGRTHFVWSQPLMPVPINGILHPAGGRNSAPCRVVGRAKAGRPYIPGAVFHNARPAPQGYYPIEVRRRLSMSRSPRRRWQGSASCRSDRGTRPRRRRAGAVCKVIRLATPILSNSPPPQLQPLGSPQEQSPARPPLGAPPRAPQGSRRPRPTLRRRSDDWPLPPPDATGVPTCSNRASIFLGVNFPVLHIQPPTFTPWLLRRNNRPFRVIGVLPFTGPFGSGRMYQYPSLADRTPDCKAKKRAKESKSLPGRG